jgi:sugar lactone lactonase YvrE/transcriptional regulator with XRE-family HTH domain
MLLRRHRLAAGLTQERLAESAGISARGVSDLERGVSVAPREDTVLRLAEALQLTDEERSRFVTTTHELRASADERIVPLQLVPAAAQEVLPPGPRIGRRRVFVRARWTRIVAIAGIVVLLGAAVAVRLVVHGAGHTQSRGTVLPVASRPMAIWGEPPGKPGHLQYPDGVAVDRQGNVYVADLRLNIVQKYSPAGQPLAEWGDSNSGGVRFDGPVALTVDSRGDVYVLDKHIQRLQKVSPTGVVMARWPVQGNSVAVDGRGRIYVLDAGENVVRELSASGTHLDTWGSTGNAPGEFTHPLGIGLDTQGNVYVDDAQNHRIEEFARGSHRLVRVMHVAGVAPFAAGVAVDVRGFVYGTDLADALVFKLAPDGTVLARWGASGPARGVFQSPESVAVDGQGDVYVADADKGQIDKFSPRGRLLAKWTATGSGGIHFNDAIGIALDRQGNVYVAESGGESVKKFSPAGSPLGSWPAHLSTLGWANESQGGIAVDGAGKVYVAEGSTGQDIVAVFAPSGRQLYHIGGYLDSPEGVAVDGAGTVFVADSSNNRILKYSPAGKLLARWGARDSSQFSFPEGLAVDGGGDVYVVDSNNGRVVKLSGRGTLLAQWGRLGSGALEFAFRRGCGIAVDRQGRIYVADTGNDRVQILSATGKLLQILGGPGTGPGQFATPSGLTVDARGDLYVMDWGNNRIQKFAPGR